MLEEPKRASDLFYYTDRDIGKGSVRAWAFKLKCPKCGEFMSKPKNSRGRPDKKAKFYECPKCGYRMPNKEYEEKLILNVQYVCPNCKYKGEIQIPFKRKNVSFSVFDEAKNKKVRKSVKAFVFKCEKCGEPIYITKKLKEIPKAR